MRISDWSSDVCSSDLAPTALVEVRRALGRPLHVERLAHGTFDRRLSEIYADAGIDTGDAVHQLDVHGSRHSLAEDIPDTADLLATPDAAPISRLINSITARGTAPGHARQTTGGQGHRGAVRVEH